MKTDLFLNATALSMLACERRYQVSALWGYSQFTSPEASFGSEFHEFAKELAVSPTEVNPIEYFSKTRPSSNKTLQKLCVYYQMLDPFKGIPPLTDSEGTPTIEYKFAFPYMETDTHRIILCGTIDRVDDFNGTVRVIDHKTSRNVKIKDVLSEYESYIQIPFYMWVLKNYLIEFFHQPEQDKIRAGLSGQYHGIFLSFEPQKFELGNVISLTADMEQDMVELIQTAAQKMLAIYTLGDKLAPPTGFANKACKYCFLRNLCITRNHQDIYRFLHAQTPVPYDPRTFR